MPKLRFQPVTADLWPQFEKLFGSRGACGGCWCMLSRLKRADFEKRKGAANKRAMKKIIASGEIPGILAFDGTEPIGWCSVARRETFPALERSRNLKRVDEKEVWSIVCLFVTRQYRGQGVSVKLLQAAADYVRVRGGEIVEGYPFEPKDTKWPDAFAWMGTVSAFRQAGFEEVLRRSPSRPIMRYYLVQ